MIKAQTNIKIPPHGNTKYPWRIMGVNDSFLIKGAVSAGARVNYANEAYKPKKFISKKVKNGVRVWRTK